MNYCPFLKLSHPYEEGKKKR